jgi:arylsulfatase A-like enzyme
MRMTLHSVLLGGLAAACCLPGPCPAAEPARPATQGRPNILWITCEDLSPVLGCYGDRQAITPNLDRLAAEGVRYTRAYANASVCSPARSTLITGMYAVSLGTQHLRSVLPLPPEVRPFPVYLRRAGYYCTNNFKEDYQFKTPPETWDESSRRAHWRKRKPGQPFFSVFNFMTTHQSRIRFKEKQIPAMARLKPGQRHDPAKMALPPYYPDTPLVRRDVARVYDLATAMDYQVGDLLKQLEEDGLADDTIVFFYSDGGTGMPRHKRFLHDSGIHVPLIIRFPEKYKHLAPAAPGSTTDRLVSFVDFAPTVLSLAGIKVPKIMQGVPLLGPQAGKPRKYVFAFRDRVDEVYEMSRAVTDGRYELIENYMPHRPRMQRSTFSEITNTRKELRRLAAEGKLTGAAKELMSPTKPRLELYDTTQDPYNVHNLADSPEHRGTVERLHARLCRWMIDTRDTGLLPEPEMFRRSAGRSPYTMARTPGKFPVEAVLAAAELVGAGPETRPKQAALLAHADPAVRFWAAVGLLAQGTAARPAEEKLAAALRDRCPEVRCTAAEALVKLGRRKEAVPVLMAGLEQKDVYSRLYAAITLGQLGPEVRLDLDAVAKAIEANRAKGDYPMFIRWALGHVLENLGLPNTAGALP